MAFSPCLLFLIFCRNPYKTHRYIQDLQEEVSSSTRRPHNRRLLRGDGDGGSSPRRTAAHTSGEANTSSAFALATVTPHVIRYSVMPTSAPVRGRAGRRARTWPVLTLPQSGAVGGLMTRTSLDRSTIDWSQLTRPYPVGLHQQHRLQRQAALTRPRGSTSGRRTPPGAPGNAGITVQRRTSDNETFWRRIFGSADCESRDRYCVMTSLIHMALT